MRCEFCSVREMAERFGDYLDAQEDVYQLILGNMIHVKKQQDLGQGVPADTCFGAILEDSRDQPLWLFCNFLPYTMVVAPVCPREQETEEACARQEEACAAALAEAVKKKKITVTGIQSTEGFAEAFRNAYGGDYNLELSMDIMTARKIQDLPRRGVLTHATAEDLEEIVPMGIAFARDCLHKEVTEKEEREAARVRITAPDSIVWLYRQIGNVIGMAASTRKLPRGRSINYVYIKPEFRGQGYCKEMMSALGQECMVEGCEYITLYVDRTNPVSNAAYTAVGFEYGPHFESWALK